MIMDVDEHVIVGPRELHPERIAYIVIEHDLRAGLANEAVIAQLEGRGRHQHMGRTQMIGEGFAKHIAQPLEWCGRVEMAAAKRGESAFGDPELRHFSYAPA